MSSLEMPCLFFLHAPWHIVRELTVNSLQIILHASVQYIVENGITKLSKFLGLDINYPELARLDTPIS